MELKKYKLEEIANIVNGATPSTSCEENYDGDIVWITPKDLSDQRSKYIDRGNRNITQKGCDSCSVQMIPAYNILMSSRAPIGLLAINTIECCTNQGFKNIIVDKSICDIDYLYYYLKYHIKEIEAIGSGTTFKEVSKTSLQQFEIALPALEVQKHIASILSNIDCKIELNRAINQNLEAMAKQLYDYWFVQFDFPDENGRPYKSSGGKMVWNDKLKREIPKGWKDITFNSFINKNKAGDWGDDIPKDGTIKVGCVRGADIIKLNDVPSRYITSKHSDRLLEDGDIVIEVSGGSPIQATGRVALITNGVIERNGGALVCSNFCQSFSMKKRVFSEYFYYLWKNLYDNDNMFNFEGKTSGIKNFQTEVFLANHWFEVPKQLIETFHAVVLQYHLMIDQNIAESNNLIKLRDELLPLLMNGQVSVNSDLAAILNLFPQKHYL